MLIAAGMLALLVVLSGASAIDSSLTFNFFRQRTIFRNNGGSDLCRLCYGDYDCLTMDKAACEYNAKTAAILYNGNQQEPKNTALMAQIDSMLNGLMIQESIEKYEDCVPIVSSYSNCNRENICTGCRKCDCTLEGKWNCSLVQHCRPDPKDVDHRMLVFVMEKLKSDQRPVRVKREAVNIRLKPKLQTDNIESLLKWFYEDTAPEQQKASKIAHMKEASPKTKRDSENEPTIFPLDDVLSVIGLDTNDSSTDDAATPNHVDNNDSSKDIDEFLQMLSLEEGKETKSPALDAPTKAIVNFGNDNNNNVTLDTDNLNKKDTNGKLNKQVLLENDFNLMDSLGFINLINVMKRDVNQVNKTIDNANVETKNLFINLEDNPVTDPNKKFGINNVTIKEIINKNETKNMTYPEQVLQNDVLDAITKLIVNKNKEIEQLIKIRESLIHFMKNYNFNSTVHYESKFGSNNTNTIFKNEVKLNNYDNIRRSFSNNNASLVGKYLKKLKNDINYVVGDIIAIRKYQNTRILSDDLKLLLKAITYFLKKNRATVEEKKSNTVAADEVKSFRRQFSPTNIDTSLNPISTAVIEMLELIDKDMPTSNALVPLSPKANKVLKRVVDKNYIDDFRFNRNGGNKNLTTDLNNIGRQWQELTMNIVNCAAADRLHNMKLLHLTLSNDMEQLKNAYTLSNFLYSRRMSYVDENERKAIIDRINEDLIRVDSIIRHYQKEKVKKVKKTKQKPSLFKKIKGLWKTSKNDLINVINKRSRSRIVKEMERKKIEDEKKRAFLEIIQKWQDNLDIMPYRNKRSIREYTKLKNRMKNIIPHYLRGKLHPALNAKGIGVRKKMVSYKMRPKSTVHPSAKMAITTTKPKAIKLNKMKQKH